MSLALPEVKNCCSCISLETGAKIIGFSHAVLSGAAIVQLGFEEVDYFHRHLYRRGSYYVPNFVYFTDVGVTLHFIFAFYLLQGIYNKKTYYLMSWIILQVSTIIVGIFLLLIALGVLFGLGRPHNIKSIQMDFDRLILGIIFTLISCYNTLIINSHRKRMTTNTPQS